MWRSSSVNHTAHHEPRLPSQPHIVVYPLGSLTGPDLEPLGAPGPERDRQLDQAPIGERAGGGHGTRPTREGFVLHPALVGAHTPFGRARGRRHEVDIRAPRPE